MTTTVVKTIRASGGDYTTLSAWEAANEGDLVTADEVRVAECYNDWPLGLNDTVIIAGSITDATRYLKITVAEGHRHDGTPGSGFWVYHGSAVVVSIVNMYTVVEHIEAVSKATTGSIFAISAGGRFSTVFGCIAKSDPTATGGAIRTTAPDSQSPHKIRACLAYGGNLGFVGANFQTNYFENCVAVNCTAGFHCGSGAANRLTNCLAYNCDTSYSGTWASTSSNNAASDGSLIAPIGTSPYLSDVTSEDFVDAAGGDFHLSSGSGLRGAGVNLFADFTTDIDGDTWPSIGPWDIGFDYYVASGPSVPTLSSAMATSITATSAVPQVTLTF